MRIYEFILILKNYDFKFFLIFFKFLIYNNFSILRFEKWGFLKFCYKIKGFNKGFLVLFRFFSNFFFLKKFIIYLKFNDLVLRFFFLLIKKNYNSITFDTFKKIFKNEFFKKKNKKKN